jgi:MoaA/NifB/PqqE/SkfB family radical SAM enzyme
VANVKGSNMSFDEVRSVLLKYFGKGVRFLYLAGGEPYLWRDGERRLRDVVRLAREIGYLKVHIYTNGTVRMDADADLTWVSIDGIGETFRKIRGIPLERILRKLRVFSGRFAIVFVINTINYSEIRAFLEFFRQEFPGTRVMFYFHTPYYGIDQLYLSQRQRHEAVDTLLACKRDGFPVINSKTGLKYYLSGNPGLPAPHWWIVDEAGEYPCCRSSNDPGVCRDCGYTMCGEFLQARNGRPGALLSMLRMA